MLSRTMYVCCENSLMSEYGARLKLAMELNGWTNQAALARAIGVQKATINQVLLSLIHISEPTRHFKRSRMPSSA